MSTPWIPPPVGGTRIGLLPAAPHFDPRGKTVLVTGGAGFIGHNFIRFLIRKYDCKVKVIDNLWRGSLDNIRDLIDVSCNFTS